MLALHSHCTLHSHYTPTSNVRRFRSPLTPTLSLTHLGIPPPTARPNPLQGKADRLERIRHKTMRQKDLWSLAQSLREQVAYCGTRAGRSLTAL